MTIPPMEELLGPSGLFSRRFPNFEYRRQQVDLAEEVRSTLLDVHGSMLAAEAPPGIGKTFSLLVPSLLWAAEMGKRILVLTGTIPLQEQLIEKDLPALDSVLQLGLPYGLMKGRGNYACLLRAEETTGSAGVTEGYLSYGDGRGASRQVEAWLRSTETGDISELSLAPQSPAVHRIAASSRTCLGYRCPMREHCFIQKLLKKAQDWSVVVANYHLFFSYLLGSKTSFPVAYDLLICDEAHRIPEAVRSSMAMSVSRDDIARLVRNRAFLGDGAATEGTVERRSALLSEIRQESSRFFDLLEVKYPAAKSSMKAKNEELWHQQQVLSGKMDALLDTVPGTESSDSRDEDRSLELWMDEIQRTKAALQWCTAVDHFPEWAYWKDGTALVSAPATANEEASQCFEGACEKTFFVSATLALGGKWDYWMKETGVRPSRFFIGETPFDMERQMEIVVVDTGLTVGDPQYDGTVCRVVEKLTDANGGRTLVLASSHRLLRKIGETFRKKARPYNILVQGDLPRNELLDLFRKDATSVLVGSASFREGVDIPGDGLTQVIIDRIPFPHPGDPMVEARTALEGSEAFFRNTLPEAKLVLKQAAGRLIRSRSDKGRVVIVDGRVLSRKEWNIPGVLPMVPYRLLLVPPSKVAPSKWV